MRPITTIVAALIFVAGSGAAFSQETATNGNYVSKAEYQRLKDEHEKLKQDMDLLKSQMQEISKQGAAPQTAAWSNQVQELQKKVAAQQSESDQALDDMDKRIKEARQMAKDSFPGSTKMLLTGYGSAGFIAQDHGGAKQFNATFNPIFLWKVSDRLLFEGELEAELEGHETSLALEMAQISYLPNDSMTIGAGKFLNPMNYFVERQHMGWINKFPDKPLAVYDGLTPEANVGFQIRGGIPVGPTKFGYAFYVANAPELNMDPGSFAPEELGTLEWNNFDNVGNHVAVGGRVGFYPIPELEVGYGFQYADVTPPRNSSVNSLLQSVDLSYVRESARLKGIINLKAQWVWSHVDKFTYDPDDTIGGPFVFNNSRDGGYAQLAYRPSRIENAFAKNLEPVFRFDKLNQARTPAGVDETRYTVGLNYWLGQSTVFKLAYEFDGQSGPEADRHNAVLLQFVAGF